MPTKPDPYNLHPTFERDVAALCATNPEFFSRVGYALDPDAIGDPTCQLAVRATGELARELGAAPTRADLVLQHLARRMHEGKVTIEQLNAVGSLLDAFEDQTPRADADQVVNTLAPVLRRRAEGDALKRGFDTFAKRGDVAEVIDLIQAAQRIGAVDVAASGLEVGTDAAWLAIGVATQVERLSTGIIELNNLLGGGAARGELGVVSMRTGGGKSTTLTQFAAQSIWCGHHTLVATTEVSTELWLARIYANLTAVPIDQIAPGTAGGDAVQRRLSEVRDQLGANEVRYFPPGVTTVGDLRAWARERARKHGPVVTLIVDTADDLTVVTKKELAGHERVKKVYTELRSLVKDELKAWAWTCSQPKAAPSTGRSRKRIDTDDLADGMAKARVCDKLLCGDVNEDQTMIEFWLPKNRTGRARTTTGPIPIDLSCAIVGPVVRFPAGGATNRR